MMKMITIKITEDAYNELISKKRDEESISELIIRLITPSCQPNGHKLRKYSGVWNNFN